MGESRFSAGAIFRRFRRSPPKTDHLLEAKRALRRYQRKYYLSCGWLKRREFYRTFGDTGHTATEAIVQGRPGKPARDRSQTGPMEDDATGSKNAGRKPGNRQLHDDYTVPGAILRAPARVNSGTNPSKNTVSSPNPHQPYPGSLASHPPSLPAAPEPAASSPAPQATTRVRSDLPPTPAISLVSFPPLSTIQDIDAPIALPSLLPTHHEDDAAVAPGQPSGAPPATEPTKPPSSPPPPNKTAARTPPPLCTARLSRETLKRLLDTLDHGLAHTRYAVSGRAALAVWGWGANTTSVGSSSDGKMTTTTSSPVRLPSRVSVLCPAADLDVILAWARTAGWWVYPSSSSSSETNKTETDGDVNGGQEGREEEEEKESIIGLPISSPEEAGAERVERVWAVQLRTVEGEAAWRRLRRVSPLADLEPPYVGWVGEMMRTSARVLAVPTLLDEFARGWWAADATGRPKKAARLAGMILWILERLARDAAEAGGNGGTWRLTSATVPFVTDGPFWVPFVRSYPAAGTLFARCGLRFSDRGFVESSEVVAASASRGLLCEEVWTGSRFLTVWTAADDDSVGSETDSTTDNGSERLATVSSVADRKDNHSDRKTKQPSAGKPQIVSSIVPNASVGSFSPDSFRSRVARLRNEDASSRSNPLPRPSERRMPMPGHDNDLSRFAPDSFRAGVAAGGGIYGRPDSGHDPIGPVRERVLKLTDPYLRLLPK